MSPAAGAGGGRGEDAEEDRGYGTAARLFHWTTVAMVGVMIPVGLAMTSDAFQRWADPLYVLHKGLGSVLLVLVLARLAWKVLGPRTRTLSPGSSPLERRLASLTHGALYALLLLQAGSGYVRTVGDGYPIELLDTLGVPPLLPEMPEVAGILVVVHRFTSVVLVGAIGAHVAAAVQHHLAAGDGALRRMWPPVRRGGS